MEFQNVHLLAAAARRAGHHGAPGYIRAGLLHSMAGSSFGLFDLRFNKIRGSKLVRFQGLTGVVE